MTGQAAKKKHRFAAMPLRALRDLRMTGRHLRLLGIVAGHDQLDRNGQGCWAAQARLAKLASCGEHHVSELLGDLRDWSYLKIQKHPKDHRRRVYRVIYNEQDSRWDEEIKNTSHRGEASNPDTSCPQGKIHPARGGYSADQTGENCPNDADISQNSSSGTYVLTDKKDIKGNGDETNCAEARPPKVDNPEAVLAECEAILASGDRAALAFEREAIQHIADDPCLPEHVSERAVKLLLQISEGG